MASRIWERDRVPVFAEGCTVRIAGFSLFAVLDVTYFQARLAAPFFLLSVIVDAEALAVAFLRPDFLTAFLPPVFFAAGRHDDFRIARFEWAVLRAFAMRNE